MNAARKFGKFRFLLGKGKIVKSSLLDALSRHIPFGSLEQLALGGADWRSLVDRTAQHLGVSEDSLIEKLGKTMRLSVLHRVRSIDPIVMDIVQDIESLRYNATIPIVSQGIVAGYACVDPNRTLSLISEVERGQLFLASWDKISKALDESEAVFEAERKRLEQYQNIAMEKKIVSVLERIVAEAHRYESNGVVIRVAADSVAYEFRLPDGRKGRGIISDSLRSMLIETLNGAAGCTTPLLNLTKDAVRVAIESPYECYSISWSDTEAQEDSGAGEAGLVGQDGTTLRLCDAEPVPAFEWEGDCSVLVVEDNQSFTRVLDCFLTKHGFDVQFASDGIAGLELIQSGFVPDMIVCDVHMPNMNGHEFIGRLRSIEAFRMKPVIMLTSDQDVETELAFVAHGVEAFLAKSDDPRLLVGHIKRIMARIGELPPDSQKAA